MPAPARVRREIRVPRRDAEQTFARAELRLWGVLPWDEEWRDAASAHQQVATAVAALHASDAEGQALFGRRAQALVQAGRDAAAATSYQEQHGVGEVTVTHASTGARIYRLVATTFPGHENYIYVVVSAQGPLLWDVGSGEHSRNDILTGLAVVSQVYGETVALRDFKAVVISHAHIDHFGDAEFFRRETGAPLCVHELDARVLTHFEDTMVVAAKDMAVFLTRAGVETALALQLEEMYLGGKDFFKSVEVDRRLRHGQKILGGLEVIHTPGHCPGHMCLRVGNALLVADQVLNPITPNLSPQSLTPFNGLENYLNGLARLRVLDGVDHVLPAHASPIPSLGGRIDEILDHHKERLEVVERAATQPFTVAEMAQVLYGKQDGYNVLLALVEAGAHVEYLYQYGKLRIANLHEVALQRDPVIKYVACA